MSNFLKAGLVYFISLVMGSSQKVLPFFLSRAYALETDLCTSILNL